MALTYVLNPFSGTFDAINALTLASVGSSPSAAGATIDPTTQLLTLQPFDGTHPGVVTASGGGTANFLRADGTWAAPAGTGVSSVSVASANGFAGSSSGGSTPALTLSTSITGVLKGNGTAISAATSGTDYSAGTSGLATGILKSTTTTGALTIAVAGDFPTLNQNTSGTAANVTGVVALINGGTGTAAASANAAFNALSPMTTGGDIIYGGASGVGTRLANGSSGQVLTSNGTTLAPSWQAVPSAPTQSFELVNLGVAASVATNALTVALKQADGSTDPSTGAAAVKIGFRNATSATGGYTEVSVTGALSLTVASGATLGTGNGVNYWLYVYAINNAGAAELAVSANLFDDGSIVSTTALSGSSNSINVLYSTTARSNVPVRLIGRMKISEATAGTWATGPTEVSVAPFSTGALASQFAGLMRIESAIITIASASTGSVPSQSGNWISGISVSGTVATLTLVTGTFSSAPVLVATLAADTVHARLIATNVASTTSATLVIYDTNGTASTGSLSIMVMGPR